MKHVFSLIFLCLTLLAIPVVGQAQSPFPSRTQCVQMDDGIAYYLSDAISLAPALPEQASKDGNGLFYRHSMLIAVEQGQRLYLSGTETGSGLHVDDLLILETIPAGKQHIRDFRSSDHQRIIPAPAPEEVTDIFRADALNFLTVTMQDLLTPVYSNSDLYLIILDRCDADAATSTATALSTVTATPVPPTYTAPATASGIGTSLPKATETATTSLEATNSKAHDEPTATDMPVRPLPLFELLGIDTPVPTATATHTTTETTTLTLMQQSIVTSTAPTMPMATSNTDTETTGKIVSTTSLALRFALWSFLLTLAAGFILYASREMRSTIRLPEWEHIQTHYQYTLQQWRFELSNFLVFIMHKAKESWNRIKTAIQEQMKD
ncbi:MAG: hypothetical protein AAF702_38100 [Chloroflexota bacterium]